MASLIEQIDEETPLLRPEQTVSKKEATPLPWFQFSIVLFLQLAEPLTSQVISPFMPQLIRDLGITNGNEAAVGYYVGIMQSIFFLTQAFTVLHWSRLSDTIGRKPVILIGLLGLSISMFCFGLSRTFWGLVLSRSLNGALNGNIGVIKSMMAELTDETNISKAYAYMPIAWSSGGTLGPMIGGSLSRPAEQFPTWFGNSEFSKKYPYFLACAVPATYSAVAWLVTFIFLKETLPNPLSVPQALGITKRKSNLALQTGVGARDPSPAGAPLHKGKLLQDEVEDDRSDTSSQNISDSEKPLPLRLLLTRRVIVASANYACLSLVDIAFRAIQPLFFSTPIELGGLGLPPSAIGNILSVFGILNGVFQVFFFAQIHDKWGSKKVFMGGIAAALPAFASFPVINYLARTQGLSMTVWLVVIVQIVSSIGMILSYGAIFIFISAASPNRASLGATNGLSQMTVSLMRAIGPAATNSLFSLSIDKGLLGGWMVYYVLLASVCASMLVATTLPRRIWLQ